MAESFQQSLKDHLIYMVGRDTLGEDNLDMELNFIHAKCYKSMDTKCFTSDDVSGYLNAPDVTQYVVNCPYSLYLPH